MNSEYMKIVEHYGLETELKKLSEEIYELQEAILVCRNDPEAMYDKKYIAHVHEEYGDVMNVLTAIRLYLDLDTDVITYSMEKKRKRQLQRIATELAQK